MAGKTKSGCSGDSNHGNNSNSGHGGRGLHNAIKARMVRTGHNKELEGNIFDLGERTSADLMRNTQIKIAQYIGSLYGGNIMGELETKKEFVAPTPVYPQTAEDHRSDYENMIRAQQNNTITSLTKKTLLNNLIEATPTNNTDKLDKLEKQLDEVKNNILRANYDIKAKVELPLTEEEKGE